MTSNDLKFKNVKTIALCISNERLWSRQYKKDNITTSNDLKFENVLTIALCISNESYWPRQYRNSKGIHSDLLMTSNDL